MFKLGEYGEVEASEIADHLKRAGLRVDLKPSISAFAETAAYMEGRASQLRERVDEFGIYDRYMEAIKAALAEGVEAEAFTDRYLSLLDPSWRGKMDEIASLLKDGSVTPADGESDQEMMNRTVELLEKLEALQFLDAALELNEVEGPPGGDLGADPLIRIAVDPEESDVEDDLLKSVLAVRLEKIVEVRLDEMTTPMLKNVGDEFAEEFAEEYYKIFAMAMTVERLLSPPEDSNKIDLDDFRESLVFEEDMEDFVLMVDGTEVAEELARTLKKEGVIKIKGDRIAWKS
ncbi:MAG: hypothetical protein PHN90_12035 [Methanothrix sp.]|jgi:hypothetical protein|nr:hypothetical protein [Methanothrix sp.]OPX82610.1 MAG: hypothetical protein A4E50_00212 [Methanosaeta sp. PtaB.Bin087]NLX39852.1 hypothetical protein [Methanothrix sp.]HNT71853.1 hypothetical protein [Methanothrix sp.]HOI68915.1 hypothetical protein [Methanothrix sp.]